MKRLILACMLIASLINVANAQTAPSTYWTVNVTGYAKYWPTKDTACTKANAFMSGKSYSTNFVYNGVGAHSTTNSNECNFGINWKSNGTSAGHVTATYFGKTQCPSADGSGQDPVNGVCTYAPLEPDPNCPPGMRVWAWGTIEHTGEPIPMCAPDGDPYTTIPEVPEKQCSYMNPTTGFCEAACRNGSYYGQVPTGAYACIQESTGETDKTDEPTECPRGYMNLSATAGEPNCTPVPSDAPGQPTLPPGSKGETTLPTPSTSQTTSKPTTTTTNPDGSTTGVTETSVKNRDGSTTTTTTTRHVGPDGKVTESSTSTTSTTPDGKPGKSDSQANDQTDLCIRHPELAICQVSSVTKASCSTGTVCTGDAISCAILRQQIVESCDQAAADKAIKESAAHNLGTAAMAGNDPAAGTLPTKDKASQVALPGMDQSGWIGGGACFTDTTFTVQGYTVTIPWSEVCDYLIVFRYISMIIALLVSFRILSGAIIRE